MNDVTYHIIISALAFLITYIFTHKYPNGTLIAAIIIFIIGLTKELFDGNLLVEALKDIGCNIGGILIGIFIAKGIEK